MSLSKITEGLTILGKYIKGDGSFAAEHDEIFVEGPASDKMTPEDAARLTDLGFFWDQSYDCWQRFV